MSYCSTKAPNWKEYRQKYNNEYFRSLENKVDLDNILYVDVKYTVLFRNDEQKIPLSRIQDCHKMLNIIYKGENTDEINKIPDTERCPWKSRLGNPKIQFLPLDHTKLKVDYLSVNSNLSSTNPVADAANRAGRVNGVLNIYIGSSGQGTILGQAELGSNIVYGLYSAIGGYDVRGTLPGYDMGKTLAHEIGHAFNLVHTFSDEACDGFGPFTDVPEQYAPNYTTQLIQNNEGKWEQTDDNRYKDRINGSSLSCLYDPDVKDASLNEMGINFMDYGTDDVSIMFTQNQVLLMRDFLLGSENSTIELKNASDTSISFSDDPETSSSTVQNESENGGSSNSTAEDDTTKSNVNTPFIIAISVVGGLFLILLIYLIYRTNQKKEEKQKEKKKEEDD